MNETELRVFRSTFEDEALKIMAVIYACEIYNIPFAAEGTIYRLTPDGRELAEALFQEEKYRSYALERVDSFKKDHSSNKNYVM